MAAKNENLGPKQKKLIFRRYRKVPETGEVLDAYAYGKKAWAMWVDVETD